MSWTDERVAQLTKLWADGLSASQIAKELGGVTRNAVIGKVHRIGLPGRAKSTKPATTTVTGTSTQAGAASKAASRPATGGRVRTTTTVHATAGATMGNAALKMEAVEEVEAEAAPQVQRDADDVVVPISRKLTLLDLSESTCKWPTGDPTRPGFSFCGHGTKEGTPYCEYHAKVAFQPPSERRRRR